MSIVVTGAAGFIGGHVVARLLEGGHRVVAVDRAPILSAPCGDLTTVRADLAEPLGSTLHGALAAADAVIHLAGRPGVRDASPGLARERWRDNVLAGARVLEATPPRTPVVVASSSSVYGGSADGCASHEDDVLRPRGDYARSKVALEQDCARRAAAGGLVSIARPFTVAGAGQRSDMAIAIWGAAARRGLPLRLFGAPGRRRDITDVRDVTEGLVRMAERRVHGIVNLGTGHSHRLIDLARAVAAAVGREPTIEVTPAAAVEAEATLADTTRCHDLLGFVPTADLPALVAWQLAASGPSVPVRHSTSVMSEVV